MATPTTIEKKARTWRHVFSRWLCLLLAGYVGVIVVLMLLENWLVFRPAGPGDWQRKPSSDVQDVDVTTADGTRLHGWWFPQPGSKGAVLYFCGNAGNLSWRGEFLAVLREQLSESVLVVDYPGYGKSEGRPTEAGCYAAADAAYDWLTQTPKIVGENIILFGTSLGGGVAVDLASRKPHRALVLVSTFTALPDVGQCVYPFLPVRWMMRNRFNSLAKIVDCHRPVFIAHGEDDDLIPVAQGERLFQAAPGPKQFLRLTHAGHNDPIPTEFFVRLKAFLAATAPLPAGRAN